MEVAIRTVGTPNTLIVGRQEHCNEEIRNTQNSNMDRDIARNHSRIIPLLTSQEVTQLTKLKKKFFWVD